MNSTHNTTVQYNVSLLKHTWNSSLVSYMSCHGPPHIKKEIHSVVNGGRVGDTSGSCVPPERTCRRVCLPCAQPLHFSAYYSPRGGSTERHRSEAHTATHAFPCQQSQLTRDPDSRMFLFHNFIQQIWFCIDNPLTYFQMLGQAA